MDEYGNVFLNFCVQRGLKESGAEAGRVWVPVSLPDPLQIPALIIHSNKFGTFFLEAFIYLVFFTTGTCKHHLRKYSQIWKNKINVRGKVQTEEKAEDAAKCQGIQTVEVTLGLLRVEKLSVLRDRPSPWDRLALQLSGNLMEQICSPCPENSKPPIPGLKDFQSQKVLQFLDPADCHRSSDS